MVAPTFGQPPPPQPNGALMQSPMAPPDPMSALMGLLPDLMQITEELEKPKRPKPTLADVTGLANRDKSDFQRYREIVAEARSRVDLNQSSLYNSDLPAVRKGALEPFQMSNLHDETMNARSWLAGHQARVKAITKRPDLRDEGQMLVDYTLYFHEEEKIQHLTRYGSDYDDDESFMALVSGRLAGIDLCDPDDPDVPYTMLLLDPTCVFPTWGGPKEGMVRCTIVMQALLGDVLAIHDPTGEQGLAEKFYGKRPDTATGKATNYVTPRTRRQKNAATADTQGAWGPNSVGELVEWYDDTWYACTWQGVWLIEPTEHKYGEVPITYVFGPNGTSPVMNAGPYARRQEVTSGRWDWVMSDPTRQSMMSSGGLPFLWFSRTLHDQMENVYTRLYNDIRISDNRPKVVTLGLSNTRKELQWKSTAGATNWLEPGESLDWIPTTPDQATLMPVLQNFSQQMATNRIPLSAFGQAPAQTSGFAMENANETGREKLSGWLKMKANFRRLRFERRLRFAFKHGYTLGDPTKDGMVELPYRNQRVGEQIGSFLLTPEILEQTGTRLQVEMYNLRLNTLGPLGNAVQLWRDMGLMTKEQGLEFRQDPDPEGTLARIDIEMVKEDPLLKFPKILKYLIAEGDFATAMMVAQDYQLMRQQKEMEQMAQQMGAVPEQNGMMGQGGPPQLPPGPGATGGGGGPVQVQGASLPQFGMPPGQSPGRPPQPPTQTGFGF